MTAATCEPWEALLRDRAAVAVDAAAVVPEVQELLIVASQ